MTNYEKLVKKLIELAIDKERERCAKIAESWESDSIEGYCDDAVNAPREIAAKIRSGE